jgi:transcriptional regulator
MPNQKIDRLKLNQMLRNGKSQREAADFFGVSEAAISKARKELNLNVVKSVALENAHRIVDKNLNAVEQLQDINNHANWLLEHVMKWIKGDETAIQVLEKNARLVNVGTREEPEYVTEYKFKDPHEVALKAMGEIRAQLKLQLEIFQTLYDMKAVQEFQEEVLSTIAQRFGDNEAISPFPEWVKSVTLDGKPFTYKHHEYLIEPYQDGHPHQVEMKATQMGLTSKAMLRVSYGARFGGYRGILYLFPSKSDVTDFSKGRIDPLIDENPDTIGAWIRDTDSANIKRIWNSFLYLRGMKSRVGLKSIPVDLLILDELDEAPQNAIDMAMERMAHSEFKEVLKLSNPTLPDYGIDKAFQLTDQRYWLLKCEKCGEHTCLEDTFPDCLVTLNGGVIRACIKCHAELDPSIGQWVAKKPGVTDKRGYHYSQLFSHFVDPRDILHQFRTTTNLTDFYNLKIGIAYVEAENRLSVQEVLALCGSEGIASQDPGPCSMGVDQGKDLHVVIGKRIPEMSGKIIHVGVYEEWEDLDRLMKNFHVSRCVVDALPETRNARAFAERFKGKVFLNYYNEHQKGHYSWNEKELIVSCNRTESLDTSHREIMERAIILPKECEITRTFAQHLHNVAKKLEEDEETGSKRYIYVKLGEDHFRHAYNYEAMARGLLSNRLFPEFDEDNLVSGKA